MKAIYFVEIGANGTYESHYIEGFKAAKEWLDARWGWLTPREKETHGKTIYKVGDLKDLAIELTNSHFDSETVERVVGHVAIFGTDEGADYDC